MYGREQSERRDEPLRVDDYDKDLYYHKGHCLFLRMRPWAFRSAMKRLVLGLGLAFIVSMFVPHPRPPALCFTVDSTRSIALPNIIFTPY